MVIQGTELVTLRRKWGVPPAAVDFVFRSGRRGGNADFGEHFHGGGNGI